MSGPTWLFKAQMVTPSLVWWQYNGHEWTKRNILRISVDCSKLTVDRHERWELPAASRVISLQGHFLSFFLYLVKSTKTSIGFCLRSQRKSPPLVNFSPISEPWALLFCYFDYSFEQFGVAPSCWLALSLRGSSAEFFGAIEKRNSDYSKGRESEHSEALGSLTII